MDNNRANLRSKGQGHPEQRCKNRFFSRIYSTSIWAGQTKNKMTNNQLYTYRQINFASGNAVFLWYLSVIIR